ncbi:MAG: hypothetical protein ACRDSN_03605 [Pseudonocardiaceae bacterium]
MLPALLAVILSLLTGREDWIVLIGIYLLLGVALDAGLYSWLLRYQPPWMTFVLALGELGLLYVLARVLELSLSSAEAIIFYWVSWLLAVFTKVVLLPIFSLTYLESSLEFRRIDWSIPPEQAPMPVLAAGEDAAAGPGPLIRSASGEHATPLKPLPGPSGVRSVPAEILE